MLKVCSLSYFKIHVASFGFIDMFCCNLAYVCMYENIRVPLPWDGDARKMNISVWKHMKNQNNVFQRKAHDLLNKEGPTVRS